MTPASTPTQPNVRPSEHRPAPAAVFTPPADPADHARMRRAHTAAARTLHVRTHGSATWGFRGRTLSRRAEEDRWLRVVSAPLGKPCGITWDGTVRADTVLPRAVPRPRRQQWIDRHFHRLLGTPAVEVVSWTIGHGDLHVGNLLPPPLVLLDWEGFGRMPAGFDVGLFHAYSLNAPATAARIRATFPDILGTEEGRIGELVALSQLLQVSERGGHPELTPRLARRAEQLTGIPVPMPPAAAA